MPPTIRSPHADRLLEALQYQGQSNDCGPFTTATVLNAMCGLHLNAAELAEKMNKPRWRGPLFIVRRVPNWATFPWGIADVLGEYGMEATWRFFNKAEDLQAKMGEGKIILPIIGSWKPMWAHVMTLVAIDPGNGWGFANTQYSHHNIFWLTDETFRAQWGKMGRLAVEAKPF